MKKLLFFSLLLAGSACWSQTCVTGPFSTTSNLALKLPFLNQCNWGIQGYNPNFTAIDAMFPSGVLAKASGGTGTATPALVAGTNITITGTWPNQTVNSTASAGGTWGSITGTLSSQTDLQNALNLKAALISPAFTTPNLGTPSAGVATNLTGLPLTTGVVGILPVANGGSGTATPAIVAGTNVTVSGTWPNQTVNSTASGAGTVTSFSAGDLSPLFTTSEATATTTPALTFSLSTAAAHTFFGNNTGSTAAPGFQAIAEGDVTSLVSDLALKSPLASPTFTGVPAGPTAAGGTNTTQLATTAFVLANATGLSGLTTGFFPKAGSASTIVNSLCDEGITTANVLTCTHSAGIAAVSFNGTGSNAGTVNWGQGAKPSSATTSITEYAPTSVTSYFLAKPGAAATGLMHWTNSAGTVTSSISGVAIADLTATGTPSSSTYLRGDNTWAAAAAISGLTTGFIPKAASSTTIANSLLDDGVTNSNSLTYTGAGGIFATSFTGTSTGAAGFTKWTQGTKPSSGTTAITMYAPTSVTSYFLALPGAAATGWLRWTNSAGTVTETVTTDVTASTYSTDTNCSAAGTAANPSVVSCSAAPAGAFSCATAASTGTCTVNTSAAHTNSDISVTATASAGTRLSVTCNTTADAPTAPRIAAISNGVSFTINLGTVTTNPACFFYSITN